tara:strand:- start:77 stop:286 length:210 start_codon:yes stop_codon:yes gene_type:complete
MKNKVEALSRVTQLLINEMNNIRDLSVGTLETIKLLPDYQIAIDKLKDNLNKNIEPKKEAKDEKEKLPI